MKTFEIEESSVVSLLFKVTIPKEEAQSQFDVLIPNHYEVTHINILYVDNKGYTTNENAVGFKKELSDKTLLKYKLLIVPYPFNIPFHGDLLIHVIKN